MLFNSLQFLLFLPVVFTIYWLANKKGLSLQNVLLLFVSYFFYASWNWRFLFLLIFSTGLDYFTGLKMFNANTSYEKKIWFWLSIGVNLGFLGIFKYYNFFASSFATLLAGMGVHTSFWALQVILPVGISFYTFHGLSYVIDIYKRRIEPEKNIVTYALFVSYFPILVAGPIERATHLLPQIKTQRNFNYTLAVQGIKQIIWGLFKKVVVADNCAFFVNQLFSNPTGYSSPELWMGMILFAFQIYGDFSGYSDIALGTSKLFGIELLRNFNFPYFAKDIADFWRRWHISLTTWFRDYLYIPLGGSRVSKKIQVRNTFIIFLVSGFWHGANWTFILWGALHACLFLPLLLRGKNRSNVVNQQYSFIDIPKILFTFLLVCIAWVFFRADNLTAAFHYFNGMLNLKKLSVSFFYKNSKYLLLSLLSAVAVIFLVFTEWQNVKRGNYEIHLSKGRIFVLLMFIFFAGAFKNQLSFIYFQF